MSPSNALLLHVSPRADVVGAGEGSGVKPAKGVVASNDTVGSAPEESVVGNANVGSSCAVFVGMGVGGMASAVCVNWAETCAMVVPTMAVLMAPTSNVGEGAAPTLHAVRIKAVVIRARNNRLEFFLTNIRSTSGQESINKFYFECFHAIILHPRVTLRRSHFGRDGRFLRCCSSGSSFSSS